MIYYLFSKKKALFKDRTVLLFTHDFELVKDVMFKRKLAGGIGSAMKCSYLYLDKKFQLNEINITKSKIEKTVKKWCESSKNKNISLVKRVVSLRKYIDYLYVEKDFGFTCKSVTFYY